MQLWQLLKNSSREVKIAHFPYILGPPGPLQEMELMGPGEEGPPVPPVYPAMHAGDRRIAGVRNPDQWKPQLQHTN